MVFDALRNAEEKGTSSDAGAGLMKDLSHAAATGFIGEWCRIYDYVLISFRLLAASETVSDDFRFYARISFLIGRTVKLCHFVVLADDGGEP